MATSSASTSASTTSESAVECTTGTSAASNVLSILRCSRSSELSGNGKVQQNPPLGKCRSHGHGAFDLKSVSPAQREIIERIIGKTIRQNLTLGSGLVVGTLVPLAPVDSFLEEL